MTFARCLFYGVGVLFALKGSYCVNDGGICLEELQVMYVQERSAFYCGEICDDLFGDDDGTVFKEKSRSLLPGLENGEINEDGGIFKVLNAIGSKFKGGLSVSYTEFTDKGIPEFGDYNDKCYEYVIDLRKYDDDYKKDLKDHFVRTWGVDSTARPSARDFSENQLDAIIKSAKYNYDGQGSTGSNVLRILLLVTDKNYHIHGDARTLYKENTSGIQWSDYDFSTATSTSDDSCLTQDYPSMDQAVHSLSSYQINPFIYLGSEDNGVTSSWEKLVNYTTEKRPSTQSVILNASKKVRDNLSESPEMFGHMAYRFDADEVIQAFNLLTEKLCKKSSTSTERTISTPKTKAEYSRATFTHPTPNFDEMFGPGIFGGR